MCYHNKLFINKIWGELYQKTFYNLNKTYVIKHSETINLLTWMISYPVFPPKYLKHF